MVEIRYLIRLILRIKQHMYRNISININNKEITYQCEKYELYDYKLYYSKYGELLHGYISCGLVSTIDYHA